MTREKLNWRTFEAQGDIAEQWNNPALISFQRQWTFGLLPHDIE